MKITIDTHHCTDEERKELLQYLEDNCWDYRIGETASNYTDRSKQ